MCVEWLSGEVTLPISEFECANLCAVERERYLTTLQLLGLLPRTAFPYEHWGYQRPETCLRHIG